MPIYEYKCRICGEKFEEFVFSHNEDKIVCPNCGSDDTGRLISSFAPGGSSSSGASSCGGTGGFS